MTISESLAQSVSLPHIKSPSPGPGGFLQGEAAAYSFTVDLIHRASSLNLHTAVKWLSMSLPKQKQRHKAGAWLTSAQAFSPNMRLSISGIWFMFVPGTAPTGKRFSSLRVHAHVCATCVHTYIHVGQLAYCGSFGHGSLVHKKVEDIECHHENWDCL